MKDCRVMDEADNAVLLGWVRELDAARPCTNHRGHQVNGNGTPCALCASLHKEVFGQDHPGQDLLDELEKLRAVALAAKAWCESDGTLIALDNALAALDNALADLAKSYLLPG